MGAKYLLLAIFICGCNGRERKTLIDWNLRGDVQSIKRQTFEGVRSNGEIIKGESTFGDNYVINFNKEGLVTDRTDFTLDGDIQTESIFKHNGNNLTEIKRYNSMGRIESIDTYFYKEGRLIKVESKDEFGDPILSYTILANANNHVKEAKTFNERGTMIGSWKNEYKGQKLLKTSDYDTTGKLEGTTFYVYNSNKDIKEMHYKSSSSDFKRKYKYEYDKIGNWIKAEVYDENDVSSPISRPFKS